MKTAVIDPELVREAEIAGELDDADLADDSCEFLDEIVEDYDCDEDDYFEDEVVDEDDDDYDDDDDEDFDEDFDDEDFDEETQA